MHRYAEERADLFRQSFLFPDTRIDSQLQRQKQEQADKNKEVLRQIGKAVIAFQRSP